MSYLVGHITTASPYIDERISDIIRINANCTIPTEIQSAMTIVLKAVADQMEKEGMLGKERFAINCMFLSADSATIQMNQDEFAVCMKLALYPIQNLMRDTSKEMILLILAEELCHLIWEIRDELKVQDKVEEVLKNYDPTITKKRLGYLI